MNKSLIPTLIPFLIFSQSSAFAQIILPTPSRIAYINPEPHDLLVQLDQSPDLRTARERALDKECPMPSFGLNEAFAMLGQRLNYAESHGWLGNRMLTQLNNMYGQIADELNKREGPSALASLANQIHDLNDEFVQATIFDEMAQPGKDGLVARELLLLQRLQLAKAEGRLNSSKVAELKKTIAATFQALEVVDLNQTQINELSNKLTAVSNELKESPRTGIASGGMLPQ